MTESYHMPLDEFRRRGYQVVDWIADYLATVEDRPVMSRATPGSVRHALPDHAPEQPESFDDVLRDLDEIVLPGITHWQSPNWYAYFPANSSPPSILGEMVASGLAVQGMLWSTSPAATEIESAVMDWLVDLLGLPATWKTTGPGGGVIQMSASDGVHVSLVTARQLAAGGGTHDDLVVYASDQTHSSVEKSARIAGYRHIRIIETDDVFAMRPDRLQETIAADREDGLLPAFVAATVGTTATTAVDPVRAIATIARDEGMWCHVDAAYAGNAMICPEFRHYQDGIELVDSYVFNPHKWLFTNFDCSAYFVADRAPLIETMSILPPYLRNKASESGEVIDYRDWHVPLGRRFRALKLWFVLRHYGVEGLQHHIRHHIEMAQGLAARLEADERFALVAPHPFGLVVFRHVAGDDATAALAAALNDSGVVAVSPTTLRNQAAIRVTVGQTTTEQRHVDRLWSLIDELAPPV